MPVWLGRRPSAPGRSRWGAGGVHRVDASEHPLQPLIDHCRVAVAAIELVDGDVLVERDGGGQHVVLHVARGGAIQGVLGCHALIPADDDVRGVELIQGRGRLGQQPLGQALALSLEVHLVRRRGLGRLGAVEGDSRGLADAGDGAGARACLAGDGVAAHALLRELHDALPRRVVNRRSAARWRVDAIHRSHHRPRMATRASQGR